MRIARLRRCEREVTLRPLAAQTGLEIEASLRLAHDTVNRLHVLVEREGVAEVAADPRARSVRILFDVIVSVEPAAITFVSRLELRARSEHLCIIQDGGELRSLGARVVVLALDWGARA